MSDELNDLKKTPTPPLSSRNSKQSVTKVWVTPKKGKYLVTNASGEYFLINSDVDFDNVKNSDLEKPHDFTSQLSMFAKPKEIQVELYKMGIVSDDIDDKVIVNKLQRIVNSLFSQ